MQIRTVNRGGSGLYAQVMEDLGQKIINGELPAGSIVYADQLCERLGISRSVVREGLRTLGSMGLVESRPQLGTRVQPQTHWDLLNPFVVRWRGQGPDYLQQMHELLELRFGVEQAAAHFAVMRMSQDDLDAAVAAGQAMTDAHRAGDTYAFFAADAELHRLLLEGSGNAIIAQFADSVTTALNLRGRYDSRIYAAQEISEDSVARHVELAHALARRDGTAAANAVTSIVLATLAEIEGLLTPSSR